MKVCSFPDCGREMRAHGLCSTHDKQQKAGRPLQPIALRHQPLEVRVWARVDKSAGPDACWPWTGSIGAQGYGNIKVGKRSLIPHRLILAWSLKHELKSNEFACHHCDNPPCCNPAHLFKGTHTDNMQDKVKKERSGIARLTAQTVLEARSLRRGGMGVSDIAKHLGLPTSTISHAVRGHTWRHIEGAVK